MPLKTLLCIFILSAATLLLESTLTRFLAIAQFYHFAFLVISLALLGFGASGSILYLLPWTSYRPFIRCDSIESRYSGLIILSSLGFSISVVFSYIVINYLPFDSYSIAWDRKQLIFFFLYYLSLTLPFLFAGIGIGGSIVLAEKSSHQVYAANLLGSGVGALIAPIVLTTAGVPGAYLISGLLGLMCGFPFLDGIRKSNVTFYRMFVGMETCILISGCFIFIFLYTLNAKGQGLLGMNISPYKSLAYAIRLPNSRILYGQWNAYSRVDVVSGEGIHYLPGLSYTYPGEMPNQYGLSIDADSLQPITLVHPKDFEAASYLPEFFAYSLRPKAKALVIEPGGGLGILQSLASGAEKVTVVVSNPLVITAVNSTAYEYNLYTHTKVRLIEDSQRTYARRTKETFDVIFIPLTDAYRPITSGAYSLSESYNLTVEAFVDLLSRLRPNGIFVITRWIQTPPSECIKLFATIVEALGRLEVQDIQDKVIAYRGIQTMTFLVQIDGWGEDELRALRKFTEERRYDLVWSPDVKESETNRFNRLPNSYYFEIVKGLVTSSDRKSFYAKYPYAIAPPTDDKPFFFHFFTWQQTPELLATFGKVWQPFGGSGYFILLALLLLVLIFSVLLIIIPLVISKRSRIDLRGREGKLKGLRAFAYFGLIGLAFLFVEIPLIQRWILVFGQATYAFTVVVVSLLVGSGFGSMVARKKWVHKKVFLITLVMMVILVSLHIFRIAIILINLSLIIRLIISFILLFILGFFMGLPFPIGLAWIEAENSKWIPWLWGTNGCASVISSVLAAIIALSYGFNTVLMLGAISYFGALIMLPSKWNKANETQIGAQ